MLDWADDAREQTDTRIMDVLQTPCLKRQKPLQAEASSVSYLLLCVLPQSGERKEGWSEPGAGGQFLCSNVPVGLSQNHRERDTQIQCKSHSSGEGGDMFLPWFSLGV